MIWSGTNSPPPTLAGNDRGFLGVSGATTGVMGNRPGSKRCFLGSFVVNTNSTREANVAASYSEFLVVWTDSRNGSEDIYGARVTSDGTVKDPEGLPICVAPGAQTTPAVASNGSDYWVVWADGRNTRRRDPRFRSEGAARRKPA